MYSSQIYKEVTVTQFKVSLAIFSMLKINRILSQKVFILYFCFLVLQLSVLYEIKHPNGLPAQKQAFSITKPGPIGATFWPLSVSWQIRLSWPHQKNLLAFKASHFISRPPGALGPRQNAVKIKVNTCLLNKKLEFGLVHKSKDVGDLVIVQTAICHS